MQDWQKEKKYMNARLAERKEVPVLPLVPEVETFTSEILLTKTI